MPPKRKSEAAASTTAKSKRTTTSAKPTTKKSISSNDEKKTQKDTKKDRRSPSEIEAEKIAIRRAEVMGLEGELRFKYYLQPQYTDEDDISDTLKTRADFARAWCLVTNVKGLDEIAKIREGFFKITGNAPDDMMPLFNTHSGNMAVDFIGEQARRCARLVKSNPPQGFWVLFGLIETMLAYPYFMFDNVCGPQEFAKPMRDFAAACRAVLRTPLASMKIDEINFNVFKMRKDLIADRLQTQSNLVRDGIKIKWT